MHAPVQRLRYVLLSACLGLGLAALGCDSSDDGVCDPGATQLCVCPQGSGAQSCNDEGTGWLSCSCSGEGQSGTGSGGTSDPGVTTAADTVGERVHSDAVVDPPPSNDVGTSAPDVGPECTPSAELTCEGDTVVRLDSCGVFQENVVSCAPDGFCFDGACVENPCSPHFEQRCKGNDVYWFDSCGAEEGPAEACGDDEFCDGCQAEDATCAKQGQCVKAALTGTWYVTADPDTKDACSMGNATFLPVMMELSVDGTAVTGHAEVLDFSIDYVGTLEGKHLTMTGTYSETETIMGQTITIEHTEEYDVHFSDPYTFSGINEDSFVMSLGALLGDVPCSLYWTVTGVKQ